MFRFGQTGGVFIALIVIISLFALFTPHFLSLSTCGTILIYAAELGIVVLGVTLLMIVGEFDLSVGSNLALSGMTFAFFLSQNMNSLLALSLSLLLGISIGFINGYIVLLLKIPSFIATLSTLLILRGLVLLFSDGLPITFNEDNGLMQVFSFSFIWWVAIGLYLMYLLDWTKTGNHIYATGNRIDSAYAAGINTNQTRLIGFVLCGLLAAFAGIVQFSHLNSLSPMAGEQYELYAIAAAVIGGTSLTGGKGSILGAMLGTLLISIIDTGLVQVGVSVYWYRTFVGFILIFAVLINTQAFKIFNRGGLR